ncbi:MAG: thioredoxin family protein [Acidobacteria bacterium]|nr:thioredoxin family protein [Acidobacteriota bacterium]MBI3422735.1 thioredoxin family protein [Acidobacteriota bacterium]
MNRMQQFARVVFALLALALPAAAQGLNPVALTSTLEPAQVKAGGKAKVLINLKLEPGWHVYALTQPPPPRAMKVAVDESGPFKADGAPQQPKPKTAFDPNFEINTQTFENAVTITQPVKLAADAAAGAQKLTVNFTYQVCDEHQCLPPKKVPLVLDATIVAAALTPAPAPAQIASASPTPKLTPSVTPSASPAATAEPSPSASAASVAPVTSNQLPPTAPSAQTPNLTPDLTNDLKKRGLLGYLWFALGAGLLALLTPCVFPMIPITVSVFTKREHDSHAKAMRDAVIFCLGIILTYTVLGLALALIAGPTGLNKLAANPWMNLFLTTLFVVFALNLFGMFEIRIPSALLTKLDKQSQDSTLFATVLMGVTFTLTSFTCTTAFVGSVLIYATQGDWFWAVIGMAAFATAFAAPFFLFALFPRFLQALPKSGGWMNSVKVVLGFLEIGAAFKFLSNVDLVWGWNTVSRNLVLAAWIGLALGAALYLFGKFQLPLDSPMKTLSVQRMLAGVFFLGTSFYLLTGLFGAPLGELDAWLPPDTTSAAIYNTLNGGGGTTTANANAHAWLESYDAAVTKAKAESKPVFLNFTGVTCTNCRWMEKNMFPDPAVRKELEKFVLAELYTDRETPEHEAGDVKNAELMSTKFNTVALPLYVVITPEGNTLAKFPGLTRDKQEFVSFLQAGASRFGQQMASR